jgi:phospholipase/lecithinase/hemolysin
MFSVINVRALCVFVFTLSVSGLTHAAYSQIVSFGDSLSDVGNAGRFSNGPVWVEDLAQILGLPVATASTEGGTNYAWGGARTTGPGVPSTNDQVSEYLSKVGGIADSTALYTILTGSNDVGGVATGSNTIPGLLADAAAVASIASTLEQAGAQSILVVNLPDLGITPLLDGLEDLATSASQIFNDVLLQGLDTLGSSNVLFLDLFTLSQQLAADPSAYGLNNVDDNCLVTTGGLGSACDTYLFWDNIHPTAAGHHLIALEAAATVVPLPTALWLFGSALFGLAVIKRKKA